MKTFVPPMQDAPESVRTEHYFKGERLKAVAMEMATARDVREGRRDLNELQAILPCNRQILARRREIFLANRFDRTKPQDMQEFANLHMAADGNPQAWLDLANYRIFEMTNDVMATPFALQAFQTINLSDDEIPFIVRPRSRNLQHFSVWAHSLGGGSHHMQWQSDYDFSQMSLDLHRTDKVDYPLYDLRFGRVSPQDDVASSLQYDKEMKIDATALAAVQGVQASSGLRALLNVHSSVVAATIPDKNYLDLTGAAYGPTGKFTMEKLKAILNHISLFGAAMPEQALSIKSIQMSPLNVRDCWDFIDIVSGWDSNTGADPQGTVLTKVREQIFNTGMMTSAWGMTWSWTPNSQIPAGRMYIFTNEPLGWQFTKTQFDRIIKWDETNSPKHAEANMGQQELTWTMKFVTPDLWKYRVIIVDF